MKKLALLFLFSLSALAGPARLCPSTTLSDDRLVLSTTTGDIVIALYPQVAPRHAAQIRRLAEAHVYDGTAFLRVIPGFAAQLGGVARRGPLTAAQVKLITRIPAEFNGCPHRRGTVSMAHDPDDPNSAQTSFLLMFGEIPQMNGRFTVVGEVVDGEDALERLEHIATNPADNLPLERVELKTMRVMAPGQVPRATAGAVDVAEQLPPVFPWLSAFVAIAGLLLLLMAWSHPARRVLGMLWLMAGGFGLFAFFAPLAHRMPGLPILLFVGCLALFKTLTYFETAK